ncbi:hypothetical protein BH10ACI2_BH10ACI2_10120 [soil metagenome]
MLTTMGFSINLFAHTCLVATIFFVTGSSFGQAVKDVKAAKLISAPTPSIPSEAVESGLSGKITVQISIDDKGNVKNADDADGPDWICPSVQTPDVVALRNSAIDAALKAKFSPATEDGKPVKSVNQLIFTFPARPAVEKPAASKVSGAVTNGKLLRPGKPVYPKELQRSGVGGPVSVKLIILEDGSIYSAEPISGDKLLHASARLAGCSSKFSPTLLADHPVKVQGTLTFNFIP